MQECNKVPCKLQFTKNNLEFETVLIVFFELAKKSREKTPVQSLAYHCRSSANLQFVFVHFYSAAALAHWCVWEKDEALVEIITDSHQGTICRDFRIYPAFAGIWRSKILFPKNQSDTYMSYFTKKMIEQGLSQATITVCTFTPNIVLVGFLLVRFQKVSHRQTAPNDILDISR